MKTFSIQTLGCKVNQYESEQMASLFRSRGLVPSDSPEQADLRVINTCSVTIQAASKSRQSVRRTMRLGVLHHPSATLPIARAHPDQPGAPARRTIVTGCWATSNRAEARKLPGVDAVLSHHDDVAAELNRLLDLWIPENRRRPSGEPPAVAAEFAPPEPLGDDLSMIQDGVPALQLQELSKPQTAVSVKQNPASGTRSLPLLGERQTGHQRAFLKVQDGCDAHCTYCIIPHLRPTLWSKPIYQTVVEAQRLVDAGHFEVVLTGIFLGAYGQPTALRRRQPRGTDDALAELVAALCSQVRGLRRLRFSSLEPGDLTPSLISSLKLHPQVVPHFHLPLQSGSEQILGRMNRQYTRDDYMRMLEQVELAFDRPAITTDIIVGFPGETDAEFERTLEIVDRARFIHIHAFSFSPRPGTAAARWTDEFIRGPVVNHRIEQLAARGVAHSYQFRNQFVGEMVELLVERPRAVETLRHGRSERYFEVWFDDPTARAGDAVQVTIERVSAQRTWGSRRN